MPVHRMAADRYRITGTPRATPFTRDQGIGWSEYRLDKRFERPERIRQWSYEFDPSGLEFLPREKARAKLGRLAEAARKVS